MVQCACVLVACRAVCVDSRMDFLLLMTRQEAVREAEKESERASDRISTLQKELDKLTPQLEEAQNQV